MGNYVLSYYYGKGLTLFLRMMTRKQKKTSCLFGIWPSLAGITAPHHVPKHSTVKIPLFITLTGIIKYFVYVSLCPFIVKSFIFKYFQKQEVGLIVWLFWGYVSECFVYCGNSTNVCESKSNDMEGLLCLNKRPLLLTQQQSSVSFRTESISFSSRVFTCHLRVLSKPWFAAYQFLENILKSMSFLNSSIQDIWLKMHILVVLIKNLTYSNSNADLL